MEIYNDYMNLIKDAVKRDSSSQLNSKEFFSKADRVNDLLALNSRYSGEQIAPSLSKLAGTLQEDFDIVTTTFPRTYPPGLTCEILKTELLTENLDEIIEKEDKEHLTSFFYKNPEKFNIKNVSPKNQINFERINLCVDNDKDLERAIWISDQMIQNNDNCYNIEEIIALAREWEENFSRLGKD